MRTSGSLLLGGALVVALSSSAAAQTGKWQDMWFWGAQGGIMAFKTASDPNATRTAFSVGGHWLITGRRSGLYLAYDQIIYDNRTGQVEDPSSASGARDVQFDNGRYVTGDLVAIPIDGNLQVIAGAGLTLHQISDPVVQGTFASPADQDNSQSLAEDAAMRAFWNIMVGFQLQFGGRFAVFGHYKFVPSARGFLITSEQHGFFGGLRIALSGRREEISAQN